MVLIGNVRFDMKYVLELLIPIFKALATRVGIKIAREYRPLPCGPKVLAMMMLDVQERPKRRIWVEKFRKESMAKVGR
jgi:hypothetical protein